MKIITNHNYYIDNDMNDGYYDSSYYDDSWLNKVYYRVFNLVI